MTATELLRGITSDHATLNGSMLVPATDHRISIMKDILHIVDVYLPPMIILLGLVGNVLSWLLMSQPQYQGSTSCLYMRVLALSDTLYLITRPFARWLLVIIPKVLTAPAVRRPFCLQYFFFHGFCVTVSSYLLAVMSADRLIALMFPLKAKQLCTLFRARLSLLGIVSMALTIHLSAFWRIKNPTYSTWLCPYHFPKDVLYQNVFTAICIYTPAILLFMINIAIIVIVVRSSRKREQMFGDGHSSREKERSIIKTLLVVSFTYLCCLVPRRAQILFFTSWEPTEDKAFWKMIERFTLDLTVTLEFCNFSVNFYAYVLACGRFRNELRRILCGSKAGKNSSFEKSK